MLGSTVDSLEKLLHVDARCQDSCSLKATLRKHGCTMSGFLRAMLKLLCCTTSISAGFVFLTLQIQF